MMYIRIYKIEKDGVNREVCDLEKAKGGTLHSAKMQAHKKLAVMGFNPRTNQLGRKIAWGTKITFVHKPLAFRAYCNEGKERRMVIITERNNNCFHYWVETGHADKRLMCTLCLEYKPHDDKKADGLYA